VIQKRPAVLDHLEKDALDRCLPQEMKCRLENRAAMAREGYVPVLKKSRWLLLKRQENLKTEQRLRLRALLRYNLKTVRAYLLKETFSNFGITSSVVGRQVPRSMVRHHAVPQRADEEDCTLTTEHRELILIISALRNCFPAAWSKA
jgi:ABC-type uncharacterized transport system YnjBCD ATPase subunit